MVINDRRWMLLADSAQAVVDVFKADSRRYDNRALPDSPSAIDAARGELAGTGTSWGPAPVADADQETTLVAIAAIDHLEALAVLLKASMTFYAPVTVARGCVEAAAGLVHLMDASLDVRERVRRHQNFGLAAAWNVADDARRLGQPVSAEDRRRLLDEVREQAERHQFTFQAGDSRRPPYLVDGTRDCGGRFCKVAADQACKCHHRVTIGSQVRGLFDAAPGSAFGAAIYGRLSAVAHGGLHGLVTAFAETVPVAGTNYGTLSVTLGRDAVGLGRLCIAAPMAVAKMIPTLYARLGWDSRRIMGSVEHMLDRWQDLVSGRAQGIDPLENP